MAAAKADFFAGPQRKKTIGQGDPGRHYARPASQIGQRRRFAPLALALKPSVMLTDGLLLAFQKCLTFLTPGSPRTPAGTLDSPALYAGAPLSPTLPPRRVDKSRRTGAGYQSAPRGNQLL